MVSTQQLQARKGYSMARFFSILQQDMSKCYECGETKNLEYHHIMNGVYKKKSEEYGLIVRLCRKHHTGEEGVHTFPQERMIPLKAKAEKRWLEVYGKTVDDFRAEFGKNYLEEE